MDPFSRYCDMVCFHIRSRAGQADAYRELREHLEDHSEALIARGVPAREARERAVAAMGDPHAVGQALDRLYPYCPPVLPGLLLALALLLLLGSVWMLWGDAELQPRLRFQTAGVEYDPDGTLLRSGAPSGGGRLGAYTLRPEGTAALYQVTYSDGERALEVHIPVTISHPQLWLDHPGDALEWPSALPSGRGEGWYFLPVQFESRWAGPLRTGGVLIFVLEGADRWTSPQVLRAWSGETVSFAVEWDEEGGAP